MQKIIILFFLIISLSNLSSFQILKINNDFRQINISDSLNILEDTNNEISIQDIISGKINFKKNEKKSIYKKSVYWIKFSIQNDSDNAVELMIEHINSMDLPLNISAFTFDQKNQKKKIDSMTRILEYNNPLFPLTLDKDENISVYLRCPTERFFSLDFKIYARNNFITNMTKDRIFFGFLMGSIIILFFYNLFIFFSTFKTEFLLFNQFLLVYFIFQLISFQYLFFFFPYLTYIKDQIYVFKDVFLIISGMLFANNYLKTRINTPLLRKILLALGISLIATAIPVLLTDSIFFVNLNNLLLALSTMTMLLMGIVAAIKKYRPSKFFLIATISFIVFTLFNILSSYVNFLPFGSNFLQNLGTMSLLLLFSFGIADHINVLNLEKINAQSEAIENLHRADRLKDEFLANTSHELRTPLHGIISIAESLNSGVAGDFSENARYNLDLIINSGRRLNNLINDILDYSKLKYQDIILKKRKVDLKSLADLIIKLLSALTEGKEITIENNIPESLPAVIADEERLQQIFYNLIGNAIKFTEHGRIMISASENGKEFEISVTDTGIGIPSDGLEKIFNYFEQIDQSDTKKYGGTGLGLAISKHLVELHGGRIFVSSMPGRGSTFTFTLPSIKSKHEESEKNIIPVRQVEPVVRSEYLRDESVKKEHLILLVDDDPINLQVIKNQMASTDYSLLFATNGHDAMQKIEQYENIDLVLLDIMMPGLSGYDVCARIRENYSLIEKPVVFLTAKNQVNDIAIGFDAGANDYLVKPFHQKELLSRVTTLLRLKKITGANQVLQAANELKTNLMNIAAHDLKNPLSSILMFIYAIKKDPECNTKISGYLDSMNKSLEKMKVFIEDLLENAKIEDGKIILKKTRINLSGLISNIIEAFSETAKNKRQRIIFKSDPEKINALMDESRSCQIFENLISNALKYSEPGKDVMVSLSVNGTNPEIIIAEIRDFGPGLNDDDKKKIFEKYQKLSTVPTGGEISTGLGLSITKELVELHGGRIRVESELKIGTRFFVEIPIN
jgi:two-component system, sensor histidine kinase LadS